MNGEMTPARIAALEDFARTRRLAQSIAARALHVLSYVDSLSPAMAVTTDDLHALQQVSSTFELLPDEWLRTRERNALEEDPAEAHPGWPELRRQIETMIRQARWLWAHETKMHDTLTAGDWTAVMQDDLAGILNRLDRLGRVFGYPTPDRGPDTGPHAG
jgi:hypothetical protein